MILCVVLGVFVSSVGATICTSASSTCCPMCQMEEKTVRCDGLLRGDGLVNEHILRIGGGNLPKQMQGLFWLSDQGSGSSLVSFAKSDDGCGISQGTLEETKDYIYMVRVSGDRVWSFAKSGNEWDLAESLDLVYNFKLTKGTGSDPKSFQIHPCANTWSLCFTATWLVDFDMDLLEEDNEDYNYKQADWNGSYVWGRPSAVMGITVYRYNAIQVVDGQGKPIQPAFDKWWAYCKSDEATGSLYYHTASNKSSDFDCSSHSSAAPGILFGLIAIPCLVCCCCLAMCFIACRSCCTGKKGKKRTVYYDDDESEEDDDDDEESETEGLVDDNEPD